MFWMVNKTLDITASLIINYYEIFLNKWSTVHNAAKKSSVTGDNQWWMFQWKNEEFISLG